MLANSPSGLLSLLDPLSQTRVRIFGFKLLVLFPLAILLAMRYRYPLFETISSFAGWYGFFTALASLFRREQFVASSLNGWDEMLAFFALKDLAMFLSAVAA